MWKRAGGGIGRVFESVFVYACASVFVFVFVKREFRCWGCGVWRRLGQVGGIGRVLTITPAPPHHIQLPLIYSTATLLLQLASTSKSRAIFGFKISSDRRTKVHYLSSHHNSSPTSPHTAPPLSSPLDSSILVQHNQHNLLPYQSPESNIWFQTSFTRRSKDFSVWENHIYCSSLKRK